MGTVRSQKGFTLIELVVVVVILGCLAAVSLPAFVDMEADAAKATVSNLAANFAAASKHNNTACQLNNAACTTVGNCTDIWTLMDQMPPGSNYKITPQAVSPGNSVSCTVSDSKNGQSATFTLAGT